MAEGEKGPSGKDRMATKFRLRLFVAGNEPNSSKARHVVEEVCHRLAGRCELAVVDVLVDYQAALDNNVMAIPTLIVDMPPPRRVIVGSLNDVEKLLHALGINSGHRSDG